MRTPTSVIAAVAATLAYAWPALTIVAGMIGRFPVRKQVILAEFVAAAVAGPFVARALLREPVSRPILRALTVLSIVTMLPVVGLGLFFAQALVHMGLPRRAFLLDPEWAIVGLVWLGTFLLPAAVQTLLRFLRVSRLDDDHAEEDEEEDAEE